MEFHGGQAVASVCAREGWAALRGAMRTRGVADCEELSNWLGRQGFPRTTPGNHISARAHEFILGEATTLDARCALLEAVFVLVTVNVAREMTGSVEVPRQPAVGLVPTVLLHKPKHELAQRADDFSWARWADLIFAATQHGGRKRFPERCQGRTTASGAGSSSFWML